MKCNSCETIFGSHYKVCPHCGSKEIKAEQFAPQEVEVEEVEPISALVVDGDISDCGVFA